jgi:hypothetical protein
LHKLTSMNSEIDIKMNCKLHSEIDIKMDSKLHFEEYMINDQ